MCHVSASVGNLYHTAQVRLQNVGDIPAVYERAAAGNGDDASSFVFNPSQGTLAVVPDHVDDSDPLQLPEDTYQDMDITFQSDRVGDFREVVQFLLKGCVEPLELVFKGRVLGPKFHTDVCSVYRCVACAALTGLACRSRRWTSSRCRMVSQWSAHSLSSTTRKCRSSLSSKSRM